LYPQQFPAANGMAPQPVPPMQQYIGTRPPGVSRNGSYLVLPLDSVTRMDPTWQADLARLLHHYHRSNAGAPWPVYEVNSVRHVKITDLDEDGLAAVGLIQELGDSGQFEYRDLRTGERIVNPDELVFAPCPDPLSRQGTPPPALGPARR
jgi:hypothetical protein